MDPILDLTKTNERFTLGFVPVLKAAQSGDGKRRLSGVASSTIQDRHGDTMTRSALEDMLEQSNRGLTIFLNHEYRVPEDVAGTVERAHMKQASGDIHDLTVDIVINEQNPRAVQTWEAINAGALLGLSIGAMIPDGGAKVDRKTGSYTIEHVDLLETSIVSLPANPRSWVEYATKALRKAELTEAAAPVRLLQPLTWTQASGQNVTLSTTIAAELDPELAETEEVVSDTEPAEEPLEVEAPALSTEALLDLADAVGTPDITDATVTVETPFANITVDTGRKDKDPSATSSDTQEAPPSAPETESASVEAPPAWMGVPGNPPVQQDLDLESVVTTSLGQSAQLIASLSRELSDIRAALTTETNARTVAERERDAASADLTKVLKETKTLLDKLAATPAGRRTTYHEAVGRYEAIKAVYGDEITDQLARSTPS